MDAGPSTQSVDCILVCPTVIGDVDSKLTYTVTASADPAQTGTVVTYSITAPVSTSKPPVTTHFISSVSTFPVPSGIRVTSVAMSPTSTSDFTTAEAELDGGSIFETLEGSFELDGTPRPVPNLVVTAEVDAPAGATVVWDTPSAVVGTANAAFVGVQTTSCHIQDAGAMFTGSVIAAP